MNAGDVNSALVAYLHRELPEEHVAQVESRLLVDPKLAQRLVEVAAEEATLIRWARGVRKAQQIDDVESTLRTVQDLQAEVQQASQPPTASARTIFPALRLPKWGDISGAGMIWIGSGLAFVLCAIVMGVWLLWPAGTLSGGPAIASVTRLDGAVWAAEQPAIHVGTGIPAGWELKLTRGTVEIAYPSGTTLLLIGPAVLKMTDPMHSQLMEGQMSAYVPPAAIGYTVRTSAVDVCDKGTRFGVRIDKGAETEVHVFEGMVETEPPASATKNAAKCSLTITQAARFDRLDGLVDWIRPDYEAFAAKRLVQGILRTSQEVRWLAKAPPSLALGSFTSADSMFLIPERQNVELPPSFRVTFKAPVGGTRSQFDNNNVAVLPAGMRVDSYLLHFDGAQHKGSLGGEVEFDRPIVGVIARGDQLIRSDAIVGLPRTVYETSSPKARGLKKGGKNGAGQDVLLFHGANTVGIYCDPKTGVVDELRILVQSKP